MRKLEKRDWDGWQDNEEKDRRRCSNKNLEFSEQQRGRQKLRCYVWLWRRKEYRERKTWRMHGNLMCRPLNREKAEEDGTTGNSYPENLHTQAQRMWYEWRNVCTNKCEKKIVLPSNLFVWHYHHRRTGQHPFGGSNPVLPEWSRTNVLSFARINVISARIGGSTDPPSRTPVIITKSIATLFKDEVYNWFWEMH